MSKPKEPLDWAGLDTIIDRQQAAMHLGLDPSRVSQLVSSGHIKTVARGRYRYRDVVQGYLRFLRDGTRQSSEIAIQQNRLFRAKAENIQLRLAEKRRGLIAIEEVYAAMDIMVAKFREELAGLPARFTDEPDLQRQLTADVQQGLERITKAFNDCIRLIRQGGEIPGNTDV